jgi:hypothetical protein
VAVPISSSKALSLVAAPCTVHDKEKHSSIARHLLSVVKPIGVSPSRVGRMRRRRVDARSKSDIYSVAFAVTALPRWHFGFVGAWSRR